MHKMVFETATETEVVFACSKCKRKIGYPRAMCTMGAQGWEFTRSLEALVEGTIGKVCDEGR